MTNHAYVTTPRGSKWVTAERLRPIVEEIVAQRFQGILTVTSEGADFSVGTPEGDFLHLWVASRRKVEFRKSMGGDFSWWVQSTVQEEIGAALSTDGKDAVCSDFGISEKWKPEPNKFPTFSVYFDHVNDWIADATQRIFLFNLACSRLPPSFQPLFGVERT